MKKLRYANAKQVLSEGLYNKLKNEFSGLLYVPGENSDSPSVKEQLVLNMAAQGISKPEIAEALGITTRRVNQILQKHGRWVECSRENFNNETGE